MKVQGSLPLLSAAPGLGIAGVARLALVARSAGQLCIAGVAWLSLVERSAGQLSVACLDRKGTPVHHLPHSSLRHQHPCVGGCTAGPMYVTYYVIDRLRCPACLDVLAACLPACLHV